MEGQGTRKAPQLCTIRLPIARSLTQPARPDTKTLDSHSEDNTCVTGSVQRAREEEAQHLQGSLAWKLIHLLGDAQMTQQVVPVWGSHDL